MASKKGRSTEAARENAGLSRKIPLSTAAGVAVSAFVLYLITLAPTVTLVDSGELLLAAHTSGVAHPPGFPLYVMLASLFSYLPFGEIAVRVHLLSAVCGSLAAGMMTLLAFEVLPRSYNGATTCERIMGIAPAAFAGALFAASRTLWAYSTIAEVYTLNTLLILTVFWLILGWRRRFLDGDRSFRRVYVAAFVFGLALGVHHATVALMLPALAMLVYSTAGITFFRSKSFLVSAVAAFGGMLVYAYLPLAASRSPLMNWGDPETFERFWWHISGRQYQTFFEFSFGRISEFGTLATKEFGYVWMPVVLIFAIAGIVAAFRTQRALFWFLALIIAADLTYCLSYEIAEDKDAYYLPAFAATAIAAAIGSRWMLDLVRQRLPRTDFAVYAGCLALAGVLAAAVAANLPFNDRSQYYIAHDYVSNILKSVEPNGMLITADWQVYSPSLYVREIEGRRKDAVVLNLNQLRRSWYFEYLEQSFPAVTNASRAKIDLYLEDLRAWEANPAVYSRSQTLSQRINTRFYEMVMSIIDHQKANGPVYVTTDIATNRGGQDAELTSALMSKHKFVPKGLVFGVVSKNGPEDLGEVALNLRGLSDGPVKFDDGDVVKKKVIPVYLTMIMNSGINLASMGRHDRAIGYFRQALAIDPAFEPANRALAASQGTSTTSPE